MQKSLFFILLFVSCNGLMAQWDKVYPAKNGYSAVLKDKKYGFIDANQKVVIAPKYEMAYDFNEDGLAVVKQNGKCGLIDTKEKVLVPFNYDKLFNAKNGACVNIVNKKYGVVDLHGETIANNLYDKIFTANDGFYSAIKEEKYGFLDLQGKEAIKFIYEEAQSFKNGYAKVKLDGKYAYIDKDENYFWLAMPFEKSYKPKEGLALLMNKGKYAYCNKEGKLVTGYDFDDAYDIKSGMGLVKIGEKMGFINTNGELVIPAIYDKAFGFKNGQAKIIKDGRTGFVNKDGTEVFGYKLGQYLEKEGGIVIQLDESGFHGLVMALENATRNNNPKIMSGMSRVDYFDFPHNKLEGWRLPTYREMRNYCKIKNEIEKYDPELNRLGYNAYKFDIEYNIWLSDIENHTNMVFKVTNQGICIGKHVTKTGEQYFARFVREF